MAIQVSPQTISRIKRSTSLNGSWEVLWRKIPSFVEALNQKMKLASYKEINNSNFILIFMALPYIQAFVESEALLNVIFIDGTFCSDHCKSTLLAAITITSDKDIIPLAVSITNGETKDNYCWFLEELKRFIPDSHELVFIADQHLSIKSGINTIYPLSLLIPCAWHLAKHLRCPNAVFFYFFLTDNLALFQTRLEEFQKHYPNDSSKLASFIDSLSYVRKNLSKLGFMASSLIESFNNVIKDYRTKEPVVLLEYILQWSQSQRKNLINLYHDCSFIYCKTAREREHINIEESKNLAVEEQKDKTFKIIEFYKDKNPIIYNVIININDKLICTCNGFIRYGIPCRHEYAIAIRFGMNDKLRKIASFNETKVILNALGNFVIKPFSNLYESKLPLPQTNKHPGRPRTVRFRGFNELFDKESRRCGKCGQLGHNRRKCRLNNDNNKNKLPNEESAHNSYEIKINNDEIVDVMRIQPLHQPSDERKLLDDINKAARRKVTIRSK